MPLDPDDTWAALTPDEKAAAIAAATKPAPDRVERDTPTRDDPDDPDEWAELDAFVDDTLQLSYRGEHYVIPAPDIDTGLLCQQYLAGRGAHVLDDQEEANLYKRLLGGMEWLVEPVAGVPDDEDDPDTLVRGGRPGKPNPRYDPELDVWNRLRAEGKSWPFVQHMGSTAIFWAGMGPEVALAYWRNGGRPPKAEPPAPKAPQDRKPRKGTATKTR